jgi:ParB-like chromosome segregation protein Spo0J
MIMPVESCKSKKIIMNDIRLDPATVAGYETREQLKRIESMARSLSEKGQLVPIIVNVDLTTIWAGHTRYFAAKKLNWRVIDAIVMNDKEWNAYIMSNGAQI